ncbi:MULTISPECIES: hypothetical protein [Burkholderia cepacia complex]
MLARELYRHQSISEIVDGLTLALPAPDASLVGESAIPALVRHISGTA